MFVLEKLTSRMLPAWVCRFKIVYCSYIYKIVLTSGENLYCFVFGGLLFLKREREAVKWENTIFASAQLIMFSNDGHLRIFEGFLRYGNSYH